ncbi:MAG: GNAT family N-acetyltransferase [Proteobacteria bacterium]|nr:GNAT family N-acetyltransferase [Pseudomonadota bacterium]
MRVVPASDLSISDLAAVWREAYAGYFVPLQFDEAQLARHVRWSGIDLVLSVVGFEGDEPFGLSLAARARDEAWIGGFGVAPDFRRMGLATRLMQAHVERLDAAGVASTRLEVIDVNPAIEVYRRAGFGETRELQVWEGVLAGDGEPGVAMSRAELAEAHARLHSAEPSWRRGFGRLCAILDDTEARPIGIARDGRIVAFAVVLDLPDRFGLFDAAAEDEAAGLSLLSALAAVRAEAQMRVVDEPDDTPLALALKAAGFKRTIRQFEMVRPRGGGRAPTP